MKKLLITTLFVFFTISAQAKNEEALIKAIENNDTTKALRILNSTDDIDLCYTGNHHGKTALWKATKRGNTKVVQAIIEKERRTRGPASSQMSYEYDQLRPIHLACLLDSTHEELLATLIDELVYRSGTGFFTHCPDFNPETKSNNTPFNFACANADHNVAPMFLVKFKEKLTKYSISVGFPDIKDNESKIKRCISSLFNASTLNHAVKAGNFGFARIILKAYPDDKTLLQAILLLAVTIPHAKQLLFYDETDTSQENMFKKEFRTIIDTKNLYEIFKMRADNVSSSSAQQSGGKIESHKTFNPSDYDLKDEGLTTSPETESSIDEDLAAAQAAYEEEQRQEAEELAAAQAAYDAE